MRKEEKSAWYFGTTRTKSSVRTIKIGDTLYSALRNAKAAQEENREVYGDYYTDHYLKPETDEKGDTIYRIVPIEHGIPCPLRKVDMICVRENGKYVSTTLLNIAAG